MQNKNTLILGLGAFGFAIAKHLGENNPQQIFYATERNPEIYNSIGETRTHPYFFEGVKLPKNIQLVENSEDIIRKTDIIISVIPCQFVGGAFSDMKQFLKDGVTILNLSKGIDNQSLLTVSEKLSSILGPLPSTPYQEEEQAGASSLPTKKRTERAFSYTYAYLAGGMIAQELVNGKKLGADIVTEDEEAGAHLKDLFLSENLDINLKIGNTKNTELYAALKNVVALILGYYEGQGAGASTLGYYFSKLISEVDELIKILSPQTPIECKDYAFSGDLIATCFGASRNRLLGNMLGKGQDIKSALQELKDQNKIAEGYETLKGVYKITEEKTVFNEINSFCERFF